MKKINKKMQIGWQKYEDIIESQLDSPLLEMIVKKSMGSEIPMEDLDEEELEQLEDIFPQPEANLMVPVDDQLMEKVSMAQNFDCWMGHTNFNITGEIKDKIEKSEGVEVLKICSRYRFFLGVGRMFDFTDVRNNIETLLTNFEDKD
tara:strand:+ start:5094 stop:5534 length:441 start_codon:yes stop_codon:yes gene_type:complete